jgi:AcrR family transcriptional regulator
MLFPLEFLKYPSFCNTEIGSKFFMGRRSTHTHDELRELILQSAQTIIEQSGLRGLSAREVARKIGYSPGTLYNVFDNLDDLILHVEARLLADLNHRLASIVVDGAPEERLRQLARTYLAFTNERPHLWSMMLEHHVPYEAVLPVWYQQHLDDVLVHVERALATLIPEADPIYVKLSARVLWTSVHGISTLASTRKLSGVLGEPAHQMVEEFVTVYINGLQHRAKERSLTHDH